MTDVADDASWTDPSCPVARTVDLIGDRWSLLLIRDAMDGARTFTAFQQRTRIARNILSDRLRKLIARGIFVQVPAGSGRRKTYELTEAGRDLFPVLLTLRQWGQRHTFSAGEVHSILVDDLGHPVPEVVPASLDNAPLTSENTRVRHPD